jgi:hypothetical protein
VQEPEQLCVICPAAATAGLLLTNLYPSRYSLNTGCTRIDEKG